MSESREVLSCPHCGLVQFRTRNSRCRRCQRPLDDEFKYPVCPVPIPVNSTIDNRLEMAQVVGRRVRELRKMQSLSQRELAHRLNVPRTYLSKVETCKVLPTIGTLHRLAAALSVQVHHLFLTREAAELSQDSFLAEIALMIQSLTSEQRAVILRTVRGIALRRKHAA